MKITKIVKQKNNTDRYNIFIDEEFSFSASDEDIFRYSIKEGMSLAGDEIDSLIENCEMTKCYNYALNILETKDYTEAELKKKMGGRGYSSNTINRVLQKLKLYDIINDERYASRYINDSLKFKKHGKRKVQYNLIGKGIDRNLIDDMNFDDDLQYENALELALKKIDSVKDKPNVRDRITRYLLSKGYEFDIIKKVLDKIKLIDDGDDI